MEKLIISTQTFYEVMVKPHFADLNPAGDAPGTPGSFRVMDDVSSKKKIIDVIGGGNILERKDASCDIVYKPVAGLKVREIETTKLYGATTHCDEEFYTGCMKDFQAGSEKFSNYIIDWFGKLVKKDINSNAYFGDEARGNDTNGIWSWNKFDGIFKWYAKYIADGTIPASQTSNIASGALTPSACYNVIKWAYDNQSEMMAAMPESDKAFYVSRTIASGYREYLRQTGGATNIGLYTGSTANLLDYEGIPIVVESNFNPVMYAINGAISHACILTLRGNFTFGTDKNYGVQDKDGQYAGFVTWFNVDKQRWQYLAGLKAGTQIAYPELSVIALTPLG